MDKINEVQTLSNIRLSEAQKYILSKLMLPEATPLINYSNVSAGKNVVANRDVLVKLGMITVGDNTAEITEEGKEALRNEALIDESDQLTELGQQYAYAKSLEDVEKISAQNNEPAPTPDTSSEPPAGEGGLPGEGIASQSGQEAAPSFESWSMINEIQEELKQKEFLKIHTKKS